MTYNVFSGTTLYSINQSCKRGLRFRIQFYYRTQWTAYKVLFFWRCMWPFCLCTKYLGNCGADLRQIHLEDVFGPSLEQVWRSRSISAACVRFMFRRHPCSSVKCFMHGLLQ